MTPSKFQQIETGRRWSKSASMAEGFAARPAGGQGVQLGNAAGHTGKWRAGLVQRNAPFATRSQAGWKTGAPVVVSRRVRWKNPNAPGAGCLGGGTLAEPALDADGGLLRSDP